MVDANLFKKAFEEAQESNAKSGITSETAPDSDEAEAAPAEPAAEKKDEPAPIPVNVSPTGLRLVMC